MKPTPIEKEKSKITPESWLPPATKEYPEAPQITLEMCRPSEHPAQSLGDLYTAIDSAPKEWLASILAKAAGRALRDGGFTADEITAIVKSVASRISTSAVNAA